MFEVAGDFEEQAFVGYGGYELQAKRESGGGEAAWHGDGGKGA